MPKPTKATAPARYKVGLCQLCADDNVKANLARAAQLVGDAASAGARLICLPEVFNCLCASAHPKLTAAEQPGRGLAHDLLAKLAAAHGVFLAGGSIAVRGRRKLRNRALLYGPDGSLLAQYDKIHLFRYHAADRHYDESELYEPGKRLVCCSTALGRIRMSICYDLRFPELYRQLPQSDLILAPAAFTRSTGRSHWETLLRARAIENQCYVLAAAQCGKHPGGLRSWGHSMVVDPWGAVVASLKEQPGVLIAEIDLNHQASIRSKLPALANRTL